MTKKVQTNTVISNHTLSQKDFVTYCTIFHTMPYCMVWYGMKLQYDTKSFYLSTKRIKSYQYIYEPFEWSFYDHSVIQSGIECFLVFPPFQIGNLDRMYHLMSTQYTLQSLHSTCILCMGQYT